MDAAFVRGGGGRTYADQPRSVQWIIEKPIVEDMFRWVERAHGGEFWDSWIRHGAPFEVLVYNMHIAARKLETTDPLFTRYSVLETEREMIRFGVGELLARSAPSR